MFLEKQGRRSSLDSLITDHTMQFTLASIPDAETEPMLSVTRPERHVGERLQAPQVVDMQLMQALKGMDLPSTAVAAIVDAVRESVVSSPGSALDSFLFTSCSETACHCELDDGAYACKPETQKDILESSLAEDPQIAAWLSTEFGIHR
eukprot:jgi/Mesvir1/24557/Mv21892-RA.1